MDFVLARKSGFKSIFSPILLSERNILLSESIILQHYRPRKSIIVDLFSLFLNAGGNLTSKKIEFFAEYSVGFRSLPLFLEREQKF